MKKRTLAFFVCLVLACTATTLFHACRKGPGVTESVGDTSNNTVNQGTTQEESVAEAAASSTSTAAADNTQESNNSNTYQTNTQAGGNTNTTSDIDKTNGSQGSGATNTTKKEEITPEKISTTKKPPATKKEEPTTKKKPPATTERIFAYDTDKYVYAYESADTSVLTSYEKKIFNAAKNAIDNNIESDMSAYQKAKAMHDYLIEKSVYKVTTEQNKYEMLITGEGYCESFSNCFKLLMKMVGIECKIVIGKGGGDPHSWNMIKLGDSWYHVDVTFDNGSLLEGNALYFDFCIDDEKAAADHTWNRSSYPECKSKKYDPNKIYYPIQP